MKKVEVTAFLLHILAMIFMLLDHMIIIFSDSIWLNCIGRLAFPIFAFMIVEGFYHTGSLKKYMFRLLIFAMISEIPFNLMISGNWSYPFHQNVLWTFLIGIGCIWVLEYVKKYANIWIRIITGILVVAASYVIGMISMVDYHAAGIFTVLMFYYFRGNQWYHYLGQLLGIYYINFEMLGGLVFSFNVFGGEFSFPLQGFAVLALIPIWLYSGKQGRYNKSIKMLYYSFYPLHLLVLGLIRMI